MTILEAYKAQRMSSMNFALSRVMAGLSPRSLVEALMRSSLSAEMRLGKYGFGN